MRASGSEIDDPVAAHFADQEQREDAANLGIWLFLTTEVMFFGALFVGFTIYRTHYSSDFVAASRHLDVFLGGLNTLVLLTSSFFMACAVCCANAGNRRGAVRNLAITLVLAIGFLGIKAYEWSTEYHHHLVPGLNFDLPGVATQSAAHQQLFFCFYFIMTGIHAVHMIAGAGVISWLIVHNSRRREPLTATERIRIDATALYWHFVDLVWVFLLPLLYLAGLD